MVGAVRFELTTSCTRNKRASQATLRPDRARKRAGFEGYLQLNSAISQTRAPRHSPDSTTGARIQSAASPNANAVFAGFKPCQTLGCCCGLKLKSAILPTIAWWYFQEALSNAPLTPGACDVVEATASSTASPNTPNPSRRAGSVVVRGGAIFTVWPQAPTGANIRSPF